MTTASDLLEETRWHLLSGLNEARNRLAANYAAGAGTLAFQYQIDNLAEGHTLSVGLNTFYVLSVNTAQKTATVIGGQDGSVDVNATQGDPVRIRPRWPDHRIFKALNDDLRALSAPQIGLYQQKVATFTFNPSVYGYGLPADVIGVDEVRYSEPGPELDQPRIADYQVIRGADTALFPTGVSLVLGHGAFPGRPVRVRYRAGFAPLSTLTSDVAATGLPDTAIDLPPLGAALRLLPGKEIRRNQLEAQGDTRRAAEVPPGAISGAGRFLAMQRQLRIAEETSRLRAINPLRRD